MRKNKQAGTLKPALADYNKAITYNESYAPALIGIGNVFMDQQNYEEANEQYTSAVYILNIYAKETELVYNQKVSAYYGLGLSFFILMNIIRV